MAADTTLNLTTTLGTNPTAFWDIQNRTPSWLFLMEVATGDTPTAEEVALGYALQANEHRTVGFKTDLHLWALARIGGYLNQSQGEMRRRMG